MTDRGACSTTGKRSLSRGDALFLARKMRRRHPGELLVGYPCRSCPWWHVGHDDKLGRAA